MKEELKQPFFAKFLELQRADANNEGITKPWLDVQHTLKYPSDGDEGDPSIVD
jgi:hypothetical protein